VERLTIVTFISDNETPNTKLSSLVDCLKSVVKEIKMVIYTDNAFYDIIPIQKNIDVIIRPKTTKYMRILESINHSESDGILFIDNDITPDNDNLVKFISGISQKVDLAWGYIGVSNNYGFMSRFLFIDKIYSHKILRPFLWKINIGISVPGQVFYMNKIKFKHDLPQYDTVFDDLTIGISAKQHNYTTTCFPMYLGYERPSLSFPVLVKQRIRWAKGFFQSINNNMRTGMLPYVLAHGFIYHFLWLPAWLFIVLVGMLSLPLGILLFITICVCICNKKISLIGHSFIYVIVMPIIHMIWGFAVIYHIIAMKRNIRNNRS